MKLVFKDARIVKTAGYPGEDDPTQVLVIRSMLTRTLAEQLKCRDLCFTESGVPRRFGTVKLAEKIENCEIVFDHGTYLADRVSHFTIARPKEKSETDNSLEIHCNLAFDINVPLWEWLKTTNKDVFEVAVKPPREWRAQGDLFEEAPGEEERADGEEGTDTGCISCNNSIPLVDGDPTKHVTGQPCTVAVESDGPSLAPAAVMGGTHQRGKKRNQVVDVKAEQVN